MEKVYKIGDIVKLNEYRKGENRKRDYVIINIYKKKGYNMYLCENVKTKIKSTFTDFDQVEVII